MNMLRFSSVAVEMRLGIPDRRAVHCGMWSYALRRRSARTTSRTASRISLGSRTRCW